METADIGELQQHTFAVVADVEAGATVTLTVQ
jgi:antitoxin (DNA-binding transcriptional repressor) of toxin-antitoxin stability system